MRGAETCAKLQSKGTTEIFQSKAFISPMGGIRHRRDSDFPTAVQQIDGRARVRTRAPECPLPDAAGLQDPRNLPGPQGQTEAEAAGLGAAVWAESWVRGYKRRQLDQARVCKLTSR